MRYFDQNEAAKLNAAPWMLDLLKVNPGYCAWGPHEDYMWQEGSGWNSRQIFATWAEFGPWNLDDLNECVNFYFSVNRASKECGTCGGSGYHPLAQPITDGFYAHSSPTGVGWNDKITEDEAAALVASRRAKEGSTAESINSENRPGARSFGHDAINRHILIEARCKRLGLPLHCDVCNGSGYVYTAPAAHVSLTLWWLHPRKGCSRGLEIERIEQTDLSAVKAFLMEAAARNAARFACLTEIQLAGAPA